MSVSNGQSADQTTFNEAFLSRKIDSDTVGKIGLKNPDLVSGDEIDNAQRYINEIADADGTSGEGDANRKIYSSNNVVLDGDDRKVAIGKLDGEFDAATGHDHDGVNSKQVSASDLGNFNNLFAEFVIGEEDNVSGTSYDISSDFAAKFPGGNSTTVGVITTAPDNRVELIDTDNGGEIEDGTGKRVYARITESAGTWTLTFYVNDSGVETSHNLASTNIAYLFREVFTAETRPTIPASIGLFDSLNVVGDIPDATDTQPGKVNIGAQTFGGIKEFVDRPTTNSDPIVSETFAQDISNKAIINPSRIDVKKDTLANLTTYASSASDGQLCFATDTQELYQIFNNLLQPIGGGGDGGQGGINYLVGTNTDAEDGTGDWGEYDDGAVESPVDGTGGSPSSITFSTTSTAPLRGDNSFLLEKDASNGQGEGVSIPFEIENADKFSVLRISFDYDDTGADYEDGDIRLFIYDVDNSILIEPTQRDLEASGIGGKYISEFQTSDSLNYRLIIHVATTNANDYEIKFDNIQIGPREIARGPILSDWRNNSLIFTNATFTSSVSRIKQAGDSLEISFVGVTNVISGNITATLPNSLIADTSKVSINQTVGFVEGQDAGTQVYTGSVNLLTSSSITFYGAGGISWNATHPFTWTSGVDVLSFNAKVPIVGWSSNTSISSDFGNRIIAARYISSTLQTINNGNEDRINYNTMDYDTASSVTTGASWTFDPPESGYYTFQGMNITTASFSAIGNSVALRIKDTLGNSVSRIAVVNSSTTSSIGYEFKYCSTVYLEARRKVYIAFQNASGANISINGVAEANWISIKKVSSPQTLLGSQKLNAIYGDSAGQSMTTATPFLSNTKVQDNFGTTFNGATGVFTSPFNGNFLFNIAWLSTSYSAAVGTLAQVSATVNGTTIYSNNYHLSQNATSMQRMSNHVYSLKLNKDDTVLFLWNNSTGGGTCVAAPQFTNIQILGWS